MAAGSGSRRGRRGTSRRPSRPGGCACRVRACLLGPRGRILLYPGHGDVLEGLGLRPVRVQRRVDPGILCGQHGIPLDRSSEPRRPHVHRLRHPAFVRPLRHGAADRPLLLGHRAAPRRGRDRDRRRLRRQGQTQITLANVRVDQTWGSFQLSGALHQISVGGATNTVFGTPIPGVGAGGVPILTPNPITVGTQGFRPDTEYGYAIQAGAKINLPWIAPGDLLYLQAAYARGGLDYTISGNWVFGGATGSQGGFGGTLGRFNVNTVDGVIDQFGEVNLSRSWSALAAFLHYWTPQLRSGFAVGYSKIEFPGANTLFVGGVIPGTIVNPVPGGAPFAPNIAAAAFAGFGTSGQANLRDFSLLNVAANLIWSPVRDLDIGVEVTYDRLKITAASPTSTSAATCPCSPPASSASARRRRSARSRRATRTSGAGGSASIGTSDRLQADRMREAPASRRGFSFGTEVWQIRPRPAAAAWFEAKRGPTGAAAPPGSPQPLGHQVRPA